MKKFILFLYLVSAVAAQAQQKQSLKDLLYSGKLKKDSSGVIRSTDDLSTKIDTTRKTSPEKNQNSDSPKYVSTPNGDPTGVAIVGKDSLNATAITTKPNNVPAATNNKIWKDYIDTLVKILKSDVLTSKQIKKETYFVTIDYEIGIDGTVSVENITSTPENKYFQSQVRQMLDDKPLRLNPVLDSANKPRKVKKKQNFSVTKE